MARRCGSSRPTSRGKARCTWSFATRSNWGRLDCAANCAGVGGGHATTHEYPVKEWDRIVAVNLRGTWLAMRAEIEAMRGRGAIVNVASTLALRGAPFASPYSASKHGVLGLTRTAAIEYAPQGIRVNAGSARARSTRR